MTKQRTPLSQKPRYLITPSLLNSWLYIWECTENVREAESDTVSLEDKALEASEKAKVDFINTLKKIPSPPNEFMQRGIDYEAECYKGNTDCSPIIAGGSFQVVGSKEKTIGGMDFLLYGRLDVLKGGVIYDIKRVSRYSPQKYLNNTQTAIYFELFPNAYQFTYLAYDGARLHEETYYRDQVESIDTTIKAFINWLKQNNLIKTYKEKWEARK